MLFMIFCTDRPGSLGLRMATRPAHLAYLETYREKVLFAGPALDADGRPCGSLLLLDVADGAEAGGFAEGDPYGKAGLFESTIIRPLRPVIRDGELVE